MCCVLAFFVIAHANSVTLESRLIVGCHTCATSYDQRARLKSNVRIIRLIEIGRIGVMRMRGLFFLVTTLGSMCSHVSGKRHVGKYGADSRDRQIRCGATSLVERNLSDVCFYGREAYSALAVVSKDESVGNVSRKRVGAQGDNEREVRRLDRVREDEQVMQSMSQQTGTACYRLK